MVMNEYIYPRFDSPKVGNRRVGMERKEFLEKIQHIYDTDPSVKISNGRSWFVKHLFIENFPGLLPLSLKISEDN